MKFLFAFAIFFITATSSFAQQINTTADSLMKSAKFTEFFKQAASNYTIAAASIKKNKEIYSGIGQLRDVVNKTKNVSPFKTSAQTSKTYDTLIVTDTLEITGTYFHNGPIVVFNGGLLRFKNASATILGDIYVWGANSRLYADSSYLYIPQQYFYQRSLVVIAGGTVKYNNTTLDHSGLSHNLVAGADAYIEMNNVENIGFTTNGVYDNAEFYINGINEAGEYVTTDYSKLYFKNAKTILLWHQFPDTAQINFSFPNGDTLLSYHFYNNMPGVSGIAYDVEMDSCTNVMWGLMPDRNSDVTISNSKIRSIGLWFTGSDTIAVNGLVDNSHYNSFAAGLSDRVLQLNNCDVQTWSIYPMENSHVDLTGCIVGEVGTMNHSGFTGSNFTCDGSGGYMWATDTTFVLAGFCSAVNSVRSQGSGILLFAYSSLMGGYPTALGSSIIMVVQSNVQQEPVPFDKSCAWYALIEKPFETYSDTIANIIGSAWVDKTATSNLMDFGSYRMYFKKVGNASWTEISCDSTLEVRDDTLCLWDTHALTPGQYNLKLVLRDNWGNSVEAIKGINLLPKVLAVAEIENASVFAIYPNPASSSLIVSIENAKDKKAIVDVMDITGKAVNSKSSEFVDGVAVVHIENLAKGIYFVKITNAEKYYYKRFVKN